MQSQVLPFQAVQYAANRSTITGLLAVTALAGMVVVPHASQLGVLSLANGQAGFFLDRDVVDPTTLRGMVEQDIIRPNFSNFIYPYCQNMAVLGEDFEYVWIEGAALDASMVAAVAPGTPLTTINGKVGVLTDNNTQECIGAVRTVVPAFLSAAPAARFLIQRIRETKKLPLVTP